MTDIASVGEAAPAADSTVENVAAKQEVPSYKGTKHKIKIDNVEQEVDYDELLSGYQLKAASNKRFQEAAAREKAIQDLLNNSKSDPWALLEQLGLNPDELAEKRIASKLEWEMLPDEQKKLKELEKKLKSYEEKENETKKQQEEREQQEFQAKAAQEIDAEIGEVLKASGLKPTRKLVARIAEYMVADLEKGLTPSAKRAYEMADTELPDEVAHHLAALPIEKALEKMPKEFVEAIRKHFVGQVMNDKPFSSKRPSQQSAPSQKKAPVKSTDDFFKRLEQKFT